jgi:hypothetical protein
MIRIATTRFTRIGSVGLAVAVAITTAVLTSSCAQEENSSAAGAAAHTDSTAQPAAAASPAPQVQPSPTGLAPNELGEIPILEYHLIGEKDARWERSHQRFRKDLELLYQRGYRPISVSDLVDKKIDLPAGLSPIVFTFDDASPGQFRYIERNGKLQIDPNSAVGIWMEFNRKHPDWKNRAVWCMLSGAEAGRAFFGNKGIEGQKTEWRHQKVKFLADQGFELCNHTLWHAQMSKYPDAFVMEQVARLQLAVDSAVPGYRIRTLALPLGLWPKNKTVAHKGSWTDPKSGRTITYDYDAVLLVAQDPVPSPHDPKFDPLALERVQVLGDELEKMLDRQEKSGRRYVSDGNPATVARPTGARTTAASN